MQDWLLLEITIEPTARWWVKAAAILAVILQLMFLVFVLAFAAKLGWALV